jgi:23S rRNA (guanosine2251-2'-O)-methyltransferase
LLSVNLKTVEGAWLRQGWESSEELREFHDLLKRTRAKIEFVPIGQLDRFGGHQGAAVFSNQTPQFELKKLASKSHSRLVLLDGVEDPHNLGAVMRTAWLMGIDGILIPQDRSVGLTPSVHKVACGGVEHVPVQVCGSFANPIAELKEAGFWVFGLSHKSKKGLFQQKLPEKIVWAIGAEDKGLRITTERLCDELISIPQLSASASYNASVAAAIALTETFRQHQL